jgi:hypothetical protein
VVRGRVFGWLMKLVVAVVDLAQATELRWWWAGKLQVRGRPDGSTRCSACLERAAAGLSQLEVLLNHA